MSQGAQNRGNTTPGTDYHLVVVTPTYITCTARCNVADLPVVNKYTALTRGTRTEVAGQGVLVALHSYGETVSDGTDSSRCDLVLTGTGTKRYTVVSTYPTQVSPVTSIPSNLSLAKGPTTSKKAVASPPRFHCHNAAVAALPFRAAKTKSYLGNHCHFGSWCAAPATTVMATR